MQNVLYDPLPYRDDMSADEQGELLGDEIGKVDEGWPVGWVPRQHKDLHQSQSSTL